MPPKAPAAPSRGRGRGRGRRGGSVGTTRTSAAGPSDTAMEDAPAIESTETSAEAESTSNGNGTAPIAPMTISSTEATPAGTPAPSVAAATPASAVPKPKALGRTGSVRGRPAASATPGPSTRGAKKVIPAPKAVRRSKEEREKIENDERKKRADEARIALRDQRRSGRGRGDFKGDRGRGGKARGGFMGDRERGIREQVASGPFSAGQVSAEGSYRSRAPGGGGFSGGGGGGSGAGRSGGTRIKSEGGTYGGIHTIKVEDGGYISSDEDEHEEGPRKDIDVIDISDDEQDGGRSNRGMIPIRVSRVEHRERVKPLSNEQKTREQPNDAATEAGENGAAIASGKRTPSPTAVRKDKQRAREIEVTGTQRKWKGAWSDSEDSEPEVPIKPEPNEDASEITAQPMDADNAAIKESSSPDTRRKSAAGRSRRTNRHALPTEAPAHQTLEEKREWERHHLDLEIIRQELGELAIPTPSKPVETTSTEGGPTAEGGDPADPEGDTAMADARDGLPQDAPAEPAPVNDRRADRVYLFQFPPILPDLLPTATTTSNVKKEAPPSPELSRRTKPNFDAPSHATSNTSDDPINLADIPDINTAQNEKPAPAPNANANTRGNPVKIEEGANDPHPSAHGQPHLPSGFVGKLRVHASGRTTLSWGGTSMQIGMGTDVQFLQDVMVARFFDPPEEKLEDIAGFGNKGKGKTVKDEDGIEGGEKGPGGEVMGLGQVRGKFVVTPDWEEIVGQRI